MSADNKSPTCVNDLTKRPANRSKPTVEKSKRRSSHPVRWSREMLYRSSFVVPAVSSIERSVQSLESKHPSNPAEDARRTTLKERCWLARYVLYRSIATFVVRENCQRHVACTLDSLVFYCARRFPTGRLICSLY